MKTRHTAPIAAALALLAACAGGLPRSLRRDIGYEHDKLQNAQRQLARSQQSINDDAASNADLFANAPVVAEWKDKLDAARAKLRSAEDADRQLADLVRRNRADSREAAERLLSKERNLRDAAVNEAQAVEAAGAKWVNFKRDLAANLANMQRELDSIRAVDLTALSSTVEKAEHDWPAKKDALDTRLSTVRAIPQDVQQQWDRTAAARQDAANGKATGPELATLIEADDKLSTDATALQHDSAELQSLSNQLYFSWDKILTDLDVERDGRGRLFRERIKTVRTHFIDVAAHKTETTSDEAWVDVSEPAYRSVEDDLGMAIAHKDAGLFDSEAQTTAQPAGFAYIAPESQGSNQYGYWTHSSAGTFWTFLPEYLILRELLWNHDYRPVMVEDYRGYRTAQNLGRSYYGRVTPASPPQYGTHGTFTQTHYASSRYVQSGGFRGSAYASHPDHSPAGVSAFHGGPASSDTAGHRFGSGVGSPSGRRFGQSPRAPSMGRRFGGRRR
jgi:hypothetical protein